MVSVELVMEGGVCKAVRGRVSVTILSSNLKINGREVLVPNGLAVELANGNERAWRLIEGLQKAKLEFKISGEGWILYAATLDEAWRRLEEAVKEAPRGEPRFYRSLRDRREPMLELSDGRLCFAFPCDEELYDRLPPNVYHYSEWHYIDVTINSRDFDRVDARRREVFDVLRVMLEEKVLYGMRRATLARVIQKTVEDPEEGRRELKALIRRARRSEEEREKVWELYERARREPVRFERGYAKVEGRKLYVVVDGEGVGYSVRGPPFKVARALYKLVTKGVLPEVAVADEEALEVVKKW